MPHKSVSKSCILAGLLLTALSAFPMDAAAQDTSETEESPPKVVLRPVNPVQQNALQAKPQIKLPQNPNLRGLTAIPTDTIDTSRTRPKLDNVTVFEKPDNDWEKSIKRSSSVEGSSWLDLEVPVCWESMQEDYAEGRAWVEDAIEKSWDKVSDIDFTGWQGCEEDSRGIRIDVREAGVQVADLGRNLDGLPKGMTLNFTFKSWGVECGLTEGSREFCIRTLAVHEFGHALGLAHEDLRNDAAIERQLCWAEAQGPSATFYITNYDPNSVMNYCSPDWNNNGRLTALDIAGARMIYGPFNEDTPATVAATLDTRVNNLDGTYRTLPTISETFSLTRDAPVETKTAFICSDDNRLLEVYMTAKLEPETTQITVSGQFDLFAASENCVTKNERLAKDYADAILVEPRTVGTPLFVNLKPISKTYGDVTASLFTRFP